MAAHAMQQTASPETSVPSTEPQPAHEQIASLAYASWQERGYPEGSPEEDWFRAEQALLARSGAWRATVVWSHLEKRYATAILARMTEVAGSRCARRIDSWNCEQEFA